MSLDDMLAAMYSEVGRALPGRCHCAEGLDLPSRRAKSMIPMNVPGASLSTIRLEAPEAARPPYGDCGPFARNAPTAASISPRPRRTRRSNPSASRPTSRVPIPAIPR